MAVEQIVVELVPDLTQLETALNKLTQSGAVDKSFADTFKNTNTEIQKQQEEIAFLKRLLDETKKAATQLGEGAKKAFEEGMAEALKEAGVSAKEFDDALKKATGSSGGINAAKKSTESLRKELSELTKQIQNAKASGGPVDPEMIERAGQLKSAIDDAGKAIANAANDASLFDNISGGIQAAAGAFAVVQGAAALLGEESEDLQKALLKVNAALAISQGASQLLNSISKEGAITKLADIVATKGQSAAQVIYTAVTGKATAATTAFKVALATTGIGLFVVGVLALVSALSSSNDELEESNKLLESQDDLIKRMNASINAAADLQAAKAEALGKAESEIIRIRGRAINAQIQELNTTNAILGAQRAQLKSTSEAWFNLNKQIQANNETIDNLNNDALILQQQLIKTVADEEKKRAEESKKARERALQEEIDRIRRLVLESEKGSREELRLRQQLVGAEANLAVFQADGAEQKIRLIRAQSLSDQNQLYTDYIAKIEAADKASRERIIAELDKYIAETNAKYNEQVKYEQDLQDARTGKLRRSLQTIVDDEEKSVDDRITALTRLEQYQLTAIDKQEDNVRRLLIPEEERVLLLAQLADQREQIVEETEQKITEITLAEEEKRKAARKKAFEEATQTFRDVSSVFASVNDLIAQGENNRLQEQRTQLDALVEAGAITEKQAQVRRQQLEAEEKATKQRQAVRDKQMALFNAVINGAAAVVEAAPDPFRIAATAALVAAQVAVIAARPIPKFATGKKGTYKGLGVVGEAGAELIEQNGRLWVAKQPTTIYLGSQDKVYTPSETKAIMQNIDNDFESASGGKSPAIDYDKLGKVINGKGGVNININKDFITEAVAEGMGYRKYFNKRYSSRS